MKTSPRWVIFSLACAILCFLPALAGAQVAGGQPQQRQGAVSPGVWSSPPASQAQQSSAFQSACGNQPMCYDAPDFAVAVVDFRMSTGRGNKVMDATLRFVNKSNQPLILGYVDGSAVALDDQGNRYGTYANTGLAGIGIVSGANADPKFVLQPGAAGDARFELFWHPGAQDPIGSTFELDMNIREVNTLVGGQHTLGSEVPLRFQGLGNGMTGGGLASSTAGASVVSGVAGTPAVAVAPSGIANNVMAGTSTLPPCNANGSQPGAVNSITGAANSVGGQQSANATSNVTSAITNLKGMFARKKSAQPTAANAAATPCTQAAMVATPQSTVPAPAIASTAPVPGATATQNAPRSAAPTTVATPASVGSTAATSSVAKPAAQPVAASTSAQKPAAQKQAANTKKPTPPPANQQQTDTSH